MLDFKDVIEAGLDAGASDMSAHQVPIIFGLFLIASADAPQAIGDVMRALTLQSKENRE